ncbi:MAG: hypothetical protein FWH01_07445 [Oscillospiraceae bacterium]|nr:hypothetical protein [Oscillospiraceae bacterium]
MKIADLTVREFHVKSYTMTDICAHGHPGSESDSAAFMMTLVAEDGTEGHYFSSSFHAVPSERYNVPAGSFSMVRTKGMSTPEILRSVVKTMVVGEDVFAREKVFNKLFQMQRLNGAISDRILAYVDCAMWDLAGQITGQPVYRLLGGGHRERVKAYASSMVGDHYEGGLNTPEDYANFAEQCKKAGYQAFKLHTWAERDWDDATIRAKGDWKHDLEACEAVRGRVGPDMALMLDCYHYYDRHDALQLGLGIERLGYAWFEEPMDEYSVSSYKWLCENLKIPVCGPEVALGKLQTRAEWIARGACDIVRTGAFDVGGLTPSMKIAHLCEAFGLPLEVHSPGLANLHMLAALTIPGEYYETGLLHPFLKSVTPPWLNRQIDEVDTDGYVHVPQGPGMGWDINYDYIEANEINKIH